MAVADGIFRICDLGESVPGISILKLANNSSPPSVLHGL
jgi:hypothetical protein